MFLDTSFGLPFQSVCVPVLVQHLVSVVVPPAVKQNVSIPLCLAGRTRWGWRRINTAAASVPAVSSTHIVTCELETLNRNTYSLCLYTMLGQSRRKRPVGQAGA